MKRLLEVRPSGTQVWFEADEMTGQFRIFTISNVDKELHRNKILRDNTEYSRQGIKKNWWHFASIPNDLLAIWHHRGIINIKYPLSPPRTDGKLYKLRRQLLEQRKDYEGLREMDLRAEWGERNKRAITKMLNSPDYQYLKTTSGRV